MSIRYGEPVAIGEVQQFRQPEREPSMAEVFGAAFRVDNTLGSYLAQEDDPDTAAVPGYDAFSDIAGYEEFAAAFVDSRSPADTLRVKRQIDREQKDRQTIAAGGGWGVFASILAGTLDPLFLPAMLIPGGQFARGASVTRSAALAGGAGAAATEAALHATQETRTLTESGIAIGGSALVTGALGKAASLLTRSEVDALGEAVTRELAGGQPSPAVPSVGSRVVRDSTLEDETLVGAFGLQKWLVKLSPLGRAMNSPVKATRQLAEDLAETPFLTRKNQEGRATPIAVETLVKRHEAGLAQSIDELDSLYVRYRTGQPGTRASRVKLQAGDLVRGRGEYLSFPEFRREVGKALRRGDEHELPEVALAARRFREDVFDPLKKRAIELGLLPENVQVKGADSYLTRVYRTDKIKERPNRFLEILETWFQKAWKLDPADAEQLSADIMGNILASPQGRIERQLISDKMADLLSDRVPPAAGAAPLKERLVPVPDELLEEFLESDIETVANFYVRTMAPEVELQARFGEKDLIGPLQAVKDEYAIAMARETSPKGQSKLARQQEKDLRDLVALRDRLTGVYDAPKDPAHWAVRAGRVARDQNYVALLGSQMLSSLPDIAMPIMRHGFRPFAKSMAKVIRGGAEWQGTKKELKQIGVALDMTLNTRAKAVAEIADVPFWGGRVETFSHSMATNFTLTSLMAPWNAAMKQISAYTGIQAILEGSEKWVKGTLPSTRRAVLANLGIDEAMARRINQQFGKHGKKGDLWDPNWKAWDDIEARLTLEAAVLKEADTAIVTPGIGDRPLFMSSEPGKLLGQFKTFAMAANNRILVSGLQRKDAEFVSGLLAAITIGGLVYAVRQKISGREISDDPAVLLTEAIDRSGVTGIVFEVNNMAEKFTRGQIGVSRLTGGPLMSRYASRNITGALVGPTAGRIEDLAQVTGALATGDISDSDVNAFRKMLPYQNLFYIRQLLNQLEAGIAEEVAE